MSYTEIQELFTQWKAKRCDMNWVKSLSEEQRNLASSWMLAYELGYKKGYDRQDPMGAL